MIYLEVSNIIIIFALNNIIYKVYGKEGFKKEAIRVASLLG